MKQNVQIPWKSLSALASCLLSAGLLAIIVMMIPLKFAFIAGGLFAALGIANLIIMILCHISNYEEPDALRCTTFVIGFIVSFVCLAAVFYTLHIASTSVAGCVSPAVATVINSQSDELTVEYMDENNCKHRASLDLRVHNIYIIGDKIQVYYSDQDYSKVSGSCTKDELTLAEYKYEDPVIILE